MKRFTNITLLMVLMVMMVAIVPSTVQAQEFIVLDENKLGEVSAVNPTPSYIFSAQGGQQVDIEVLAIGAGLFPQFTLFDQNGALVQAVGNPSQLSTVTGTTTFPVAGNYTIQVAGSGGGQGQFVLTVRSAVPAVPPTPLAEGQAASGQLAGNETISYTFPANPNARLLLEIGGTNATQSVSIELKDPTGQVVATIESSVLGTSLLLPAGGAGNFLLTLKNGTPNAPAIPYEVRLTAQSLSQDPAAQSSGIAQPDLPTSGACVIATYNPTDVNVRSGPSTDYDPPVATILPTEIYSVIGRTADSSWYQITFTGGQGWVAGSVTRRGGNCGAVAVTWQEQAPPQSTQEATQSATQESTQESTQEFTPEATQELVPPTVEPTQEVIEGPPPPAEVATEEPPQYQLAGNNEYNGVEINIKNDTKTFNGYISYPDGDRQDTVSYRVVGFDNAVFAGDVFITAVCTGPGAENARINFTANAGGGVPCNGASTTKFHGNDSDLGWATVFIESGEGAYVNWTLVFSANN